MKPGIDHTGVTVVFLCHDGKGNVLLSKRSPACRDEHGRWDLGAGSLELGHTVEDTIKREIKEEYGTDVLESEFLGYHDIHRTNDGQKTHWVALYFKVLVDRGKARNAEPHKFEEVRWFPLTDLPTPLHSQFPAFLRDYGDKL